jgi:hypothetical protein
VSLDTTKLGQLAAELMDSLAEAYEDDEGAEIGTVAIVVEIEGPGWTGVDYRSTDQRRWVQEGFFDAPKRAVRLSARNGGDDGDPS